MRLIDADARVTVRGFDVEHVEYEHTEMSVADALDFATDEGCPDVVDAAPVVHGEWKWSHGGECSECGFHNSNFDYRYCPMCGALMDR